MNPVILNIREQSQANELTRELGVFGLEVIEAPVIKVVYRDFDLTSVFKFESPPSLLLFTSVHGVRSIWAMLASVSKEVFAGICALPVAVVGPRTAEEATCLGFTVKHIADSYTAEGLFEKILLSKEDMQSVILVQGSQASTKLADALTEKQVQVQRIVGYDVTRNFDKVELEGKLKSILVAKGKHQSFILALTSGFACACFLETLSDIAKNESAIEQFKRDVIVCALGPKTESAAKKLGFINIRTAQKQTSRELAYVVSQVVEEHKSLGAEAIIGQ